MPGEKGEKVMTQWWKSNLKDLTFLKLRGKPLTISSLLREEFMLFHLLKDPSLMLLL